MEAGKRIIAMGANDFQGKTAMARTEEMVTVERLNACLRYDHETGEMFWRVRKSSAAQKGGVAGSVEKLHTGLVYKKIVIDGHKIRSHRVAYALFHGMWPDGEIDHIDGNGTNNMISNLRVVTRAENMKNKSMYRVNQSGHAGVYRVHKSKTFYAVIRVGGDLIRLGSFKNIDDAISARIKAERHYGFHQNHGTVRNNMGDIAK